jgi:transcriptional regulator with GAF, ATPase, and Fis domain
VDESVISLRAAELCQSGLALEQVFLGLRELLAERIDVSVVILIARHRDGPHVILYARFGELLKTDNPLLPADSVTASVMRSGTPQLFVSDDDWLERASFTFGGEGTPTRSAIFVPIRHAQDIIGVLSVQSFVSAAYERSDVALVDACAQAISPCLRAEVDLSA